MTQVKKKIKKSKAITFHEHFENLSRLGVLNEHDPDTHTRIVQTDRLDSRYVMGAWLQLVYVSKRTFSSNFFFF